MSHLLSQKKQLKTSVLIITIITSMIQLGTFTSSQLNHIGVVKEMPLHILSKLQSREAQSVPFFAALPVLHGSGIVLFSIQSRKSAEYIKSDQHFRRRSERIVAVKRLSAVWDHPASTAGARSEVSSTEEKHWQQRQRRSMRQF